MLPKHLIDELFKNDAFKILKEKYEAKKSNADIKVSNAIFDNLSQKICDKVNDLIITGRKDLKSELRTNILSGKSIRRHFGFDNYVPKSIDNNHFTKSINAYLIFLGITERSSWQYYYKNLKGNSGRVKMFGLYYLYRYDYSYTQPELKRSLLKLFPGENDAILATYIDLNNVLMEGKADITAKILRINFDDIHKSREITAYFDEDILGDQFVLNAIIRSSRTDCPYAKHCIMVFADDQSLIIETDKVSTVYLSVLRPKDQIAEGCIYDEKNDAIVQYLARKKNEMVADYFKPALLNGIVKGNHNYFDKIKQGFKYFKKVLVGNWYSVSSYQQEPDTIAINSYKFSFDDTKMECTFTCSRKDLYDMDLNGKMEYANNQFVFNMHQLNHPAVVYSVAKFNNVKRLFASSILLVGDNAITAREIFFRHDQFNPEALNQKLEDFLSGPLLDNYEKAFLLSNNRESSEIQDFKNEINLLKYFHGEYRALLINPYADDRSIVQGTLKIDPFGAACILITTGASTGTFSYNGSARIINNTLRITCTTAEGQKCEYIFKVNENQMYQAELLCGITLDTDREGFPCADACVAVRAGQLSYEFLPMVITRNSKNYEEIDELFKERFSKSTDNYFFKTFKSIRGDSEAGA